MIGKKLISTSTVPLYEVNAILKERSKQGELTYEQNLTFEYAKKFSPLTKAKAEKLLVALKALGSVDERLAVKICDILPEDMEKMKLIIPKGSKPSDADLDAALKEVKKYLK